MHIWGSLPCSQKLISSYTCNIWICKNAMYILWKLLVFATPKTSTWIQGTCVAVYVLWRDLDGSAPEWLVSDLFIHMQCAHTCAHALLRNSRHCPVCSVTKATTGFLKQLLAPVKDYTHKHTHTQIYTTFLIGYNTNTKYPTPLPSAHYCSGEILYSNIV